MNYTVRELSEKYGVSISAVRYWIRDKKIPYEIERVIGKRPRMVLKLEDVEKALNVGITKGN